MEHKLKIDEVFLEAKLAGDKLFEIRVNDRGYQKGDVIIYTEYRNCGVPVEHRFEIKYVSNYNQKDGWVVFGEKKIK